MLRSLNTIFIILIALCLKTFFFNAFLATNDSVIEKVSGQAIFKVGQKRRRTLVAFSKNQFVEVLQEIPSGKKEENEEAEKIYRKIKFPLFIVVASLNTCVETIFNKPLRFCTSHIFLSKLRPIDSISVLRI